SDGIGPAAAFDAPLGFALGASGLIVADSGNHAVRAIATSFPIGTPDLGVTSTVSGAFARPGAGDGSFANARFNVPRGIPFADGGPTTAGYFTPEGLAYDSQSGAIIVADTGHHAIRALLPNDVTITMAGCGAAASADGVVIPVCVPFAGNCGGCPQFDTPV